MGKEFGVVVLKRSSRGAAPEKRGYACCAAADFCPVVVVFVPEFSVEC